MNDVSAWHVALKAAALLAVDPVALGGATLRAPAGPIRDAWLDALRKLLSHETGEERPWRRLPPGVTEGRLIGGLDLAATLSSGRPVAERGLLAEASDGVLVAPMAERLDATAAGLVAAALDTGFVRLERDGIAARVPARFACVLLDEGLDDERAPAALSERLAFQLDLGAMRPSASATVAVDPTGVRTARAHVAGVAVGNDILEALCATGLAFGVSSLHVATLALRTAKAAAALAGRTAVAAEDAELAAALVLAPRATRLPADEDEAAEDPEPDASDTPPEPPETEGESRLDEPRDLNDLVVEATRAAIPAGLLADLSLAAGMTRSASVAGRAGAPKVSARRGRPAGVRRGLPGHGVRLAVVDTLRAAAPWQRLRRAQAPAATTSSRILVRRDDFRVARFKQKSETLTLFVVDASGSAALHRLAEVKGAVELILAECYVRRDSVALIAFRGPAAELILPPTRSLVRAKRALAGQAGGGGTPLATAIESAALVADGARRRGQTPVVVFLTDGKANIGRAGRPGRAEAEADALAAARLFRAGGSAGLVLDIAPRPADPARRLAAALGARYIPLPYADAQALSRAVLAAAPSGGNV